MRNKRIGFGLTLVARYNTANSNGYMLGHGLSTTAEFFRRYDIGKNWKIMPTVGGYHEFSGMDMEHETRAQLGVVHEI